MQSNKKRDVKASRKKAEQQDAQKSQANSKAKSSIHKRLQRDKSINDVQGNAKNNRDSKSNQIKENKKGKDFDSLGKNANNTSSNNERVLLMAQADEIIANLMSDNEDDFLESRPKMYREINLFLQLPDEYHQEVVRNFSATFFDVSENPIMPHASHTVLSDLKVNLSASLILNDPDQLDAIHQMHQSGILPADSNILSRVVE